MTSEPNWVGLDGVVNMRDLGGRTTTDGRIVRSRVVLRSDNLQDLPPSSVRVLLDDYELSDVVDLRTNRERRLSGPSPVDFRVSVHALSLYPEDDPDSLVPPWQEDLATIDPYEAVDFAQGMARHYLGYLRVRGDNVISALRVVSHSAGAVVVNCAAGKDRTGTTCAALLLTLGVPGEQVVADYAASNERVPAILERLGEGATAGSSDHEVAVKAQSTPPEVMESLLGYLDTDFGGIGGWLDRYGWTQDDQTLLETRLLG
ncbi:tyrosine-protein phosphatase [Brooklawnia cerclae]|uniref:Protein tyrosine/serine phosphatase n=1 Tax=Brooklawnia cerclae TaxID=349934 RepID=A0ABX0SIR5_9ACTN|nr:tyrosine-protein phosphatase [Brooklawnia cerclae]NIH56531.1 protein tyrosine/serine phosphatase [Brooklawnia cerclae]